MEYHNLFLNNIKKQIKASFVGYEEYRGTYQLKIIRNKKETYFKLDGKPSDVTPERYAELFNLILENNGEI
jgi:hypothetical protein